MNTPEIIKRVMQARANLKITFHNPGNDFTAYAKDRDQLETWKNSAKARGISFTC